MDPWQSGSAARRRGAQRFCTSCTCPSEGTCRVVFHIWGRVHSINQLPRCPATATGISVSPEEAGPLSTAKSLTITLNKKTRLAGWSDSLLSSKTGRDQAQQAFLLDFTQALSRLVNTTCRNLPSQLPWGLPVRPCRNVPCFAGRARRFACRTLLAAR